MNKIIVGNILFLCLGLLEVWGEGTFRDEIPMLVPMNKHLTYFDRAYRNRTDSGSVWMQEFIKNIQVSSISSEDWRKAIINIVNASMYGKFNQDDDPSGFVKDYQVVEVLVSALESQDKQIRTHATDALLWHVGNRLRLKYSEGIKGALGVHPELKDEKRLFAKCDLTDEQKMDVLLWEDATDPVIRALCGDNKAEMELILKFDKSESFGEKSRLARELACVGKPKCTEALINGLKSSLVSESEYADTSIRKNILLALGIIFEDEPLFTVDSFLIKQNSDYVFDRIRGLDDYVKDVDSWVRERFGYSAWNSDDVWFWRVKIHVE